MDKELLERYRKYLTNAQVKELAAKAERYKLLNAQRRAEAQNSILAQQRQARRGLQNVGLAGREGKVISGMETARNDALTNAYAAYNRQLRKVEDAQTQNAAARMATANIAARRRAAEQAAQQQAEEQAQLQQQIAAQQTAAQQAQALKRAGIGNLLNKEVSDSGSGFQTAADEQSFYAYDPRKHTDAENIRYYQRVAQMNGLRGSEANTYALDKAREAGQKNAEYRAEGRAMLMDPSRKNRERMQGEIDKVADYVNSPVHQFSVDYGVSMAALKRTDPTSAAQIEERVDYLYSYIDKYTSKWDRMIAQGGKEAETAKREKAKIAGSFALLAESTRVPAEYRNLYYMSDDEFEVAFGAEEKLYEDQLAEGRVIEGDFNARREAFEAGRDVNGQDIQRDATIRHMWYEKVKADRAAAQPANMLAQSVKVANKYKDKKEQYDSTVEYVDENQNAWKDNNDTLDSPMGKIEMLTWKNPTQKTPRYNWESAYDYNWKASDYAKSHDTNGSKYDALVNDWSLINGRTVLLYTLTGQYANINNAFDFIKAIVGNNTADTSFAYDWFRNQCVMSFNDESMSSVTKVQQEQMEAMLTLANLMTDEERARFNVLKETVSGKDADDYFDYLYNNVLPQRFRQYAQESMYADTDSALIRSAASAASVPSNLVQGVTKPLQTMFSKQTDPVAAQLSAAKANTAQSMRGAVGQHYGKIGSFLYQTGMSMADSATVALISSGLGNVFSGALKGFGVGAEMAAKIGGKAGSVFGGSILGGAAFNSSYEEALQRGLSPEQARTTAFGNGVNEMLFESLSLEMLVGHYQKGGMLKVTKNGFVNWLVNTMVQGGVEGSEEIFTDMANNLWDKKVNGIYSEELTKLREYISQGMSYADAKRKVNAEFAEQLGMSFLGGFVAGGVMGGGATFMGMVQNRQNEKLGAGLRQNNRVMNELRSFDYKSEYAKEILQQSKLTNQDVSDLFNIRQMELLDQYKGDIQQAVKDGKITQQDAALLDKFQQNNVQVTQDGKVIKNENGVTAEEYAHLMDDVIPQIDTEHKIQFLDNAELAELTQAVGGKVAAAADTYQRTVKDIEADTTLTEEQKKAKLDAASKTLDSTFKGKLEIGKDGNIKVGKGSGTVSFDFSTVGHNTIDSMTANEQSALRIAQVVASRGVNVKVESEFGVDENGVDHRDENGYYDRKTQTIHVNLKGENSVLWTVSHELTHHLANVNEQAYNDLRKAIEDKLKSVDLTASELNLSYDMDRVVPFINKTGNLYDALVEYEKSRGYGEDAEEEVIARCCERFLASDVFVSSFAKKNYKSAKAISDFLTRTSIDMNRLLQDADVRATEQGVRHDESPEQEILVQVGDITEIANLWQRAVNQQTKQRAPKKAEGVRWSKAEHLEIKPDNAILSKNLDRGNAAMEKVIKTHSDVQNAMYRSDIGNIDFVWGKEGKHGYGISHLIEQRNAEDGSGEETANKMVEVIAKAEVGDIQRNNSESAQKRIRLYHDGYTAILTKSDETGNNWLLTGWKDKTKTGTSAYGEVYDSSAATTKSTTHTRADGDVTVSNNNIPSRKDSVKSVSDKEYMDLARRYESGDKSVEAELRKAVQSAAKRNGYVLSTFHGTSEYFNTFNMGTEGIHLGTEAVAKQVANIRYNTRSKNTSYSWDDLRGRVSEMDAQTRKAIVDEAYMALPNADNEFKGDINDADAVRKYVDDAMGEKKRFRMTLETFDRQVGEHVIPIYAKISNPLVIEGDISLWSPSNIVNVIMNKALGKTSMRGIGGRTVNISGSEVTLTAEQKKRLYNIGASKYDTIKDMPWGELADVLYELGFDGIKYRNEYEGNKNSYSYIALRPSDVKSAELVTKDDKGKIIPLSERFNKTNDDMRFSKMDNVKLTQSGRERTFTDGNVNATMYGNDVELDGGTIKQRVSMLKALAELNDTVRVDAASEEEAEAFRKAGAVEDKMEGRGQYGTFEFKHEETPTKGIYSPKQKIAFAKDVMRQVGKSSGFTAEQRRIYGMKLGKLMDYLWELQYGKMNSTVVYDYGNRLFDSILDAYTERSAADEGLRSNLLANMTKTKDGKGRTYYVLEVNEKQMQEIKYAYDNARTYAAKLSKALDTRVTVKQAETSMLEDLFANETDTRIKSDTNEGDMPNELLRIAQSTESSKTNPYKAASDEREALRMGMWDSAMSAAGMEKSAAQQVREAIKETRKAERTKAKTEMRKKVSEAKLVGQMERGKYREMVRRQERERFERKVAKLKEQQYSEDKQIRKDLLKITKSNYERLVTMLAKPTEGSHVPVQLAREVSEFCLALSDLLDVKVNSKVESLAEANLTKRGVLNVQKLMDAYQQTFADEATIEEAMRENPGYDPRGKYLSKELYDETLYQMMEGLKEILNGKTVARLDNYELRALMFTVRGVLHTVYDANKTVINGERKQTYKYADMMDRQLREAKNVFGRKGNVLTKAMNQYVIESLGLRRIAKVYSGSSEDYVFVKMVDDLNQGAIEKERIALALRKMFDPVTTKYAKDMKTWYGKNAEWIDTGLKKDGHPVLITKGMRVSLAMHILNEQNLRNLEEKGVTIPNREEYRKGEYNQAYKVGHGMTVRMTKAQAQQIVSQMTEAEKAYFEVAKELFHKRAGYYINRTSLQLLGYAKAIVENYFPIQVDDAYKLVEYDAVAKNAGVEHPGFLETRKGTTSVMYLNDITAVVNRQIDGVAKYAGLAIPMRNWNAVMNQRLYHEDADGNWVADKGRVHDTLENEMGYTATKYNTENGSQRIANVEFVDQFIKDLAGHTQLSANDKGIGGAVATWLTSNYVKAVLLLNVRVALSQAASLPTAAAEIPWQYIAKAFKGHIEGHMNHARIDELIDQYTPIFAMRRAGTQNEIAEIMRRRGLSERAEQKLPWLLGWITTMDTLTTRRLWYACEQWTAKETKIPIGSDAFYKEVAKRYERVIQNTQPNFTVLQRSPALRSQSPLTRILTMFGTQRMQNGGIFIERAFEVAQAQGKEAKAKSLQKFGRSVSALVTAAIVLALGRAITSMARGRVKPLQDDDDKVTIKSVVKYLRDDIISSLAGSFMFGSEIYDLVSGKIGNIFKGDAGYDSNYALPVTEALETIITFVKEKDWNFFKYMMDDSHTDDERWKKAKSFINELMTVASYLTGLPLQNASKTILNGIIPGWQDINDWIKTGEFNPWLHQSGKLDAKTTAANYKEWTNAGFKGSEYFYWEKKLSEYGKRDEKIPILLDSDLPDEKKAMLLRMMDKSGATSEGTVVYKSNGDVLIDFANPTEKQQALPMPTAEPEETSAPTATPAATPKPTENPLTDARQEGVKEAVAKGVPEQTAFDAFLAYQDMGKNKDEEYSRNDDFRAWLFANVDSPEQRAILEYQVIGTAANVKGSVTYRDSGVVYRDYTNEAWFKLSQHNLAKDGTNKRYDAGKKLEKTGLSVDKTVAIYDGLKELTKKAEWTKYLKDQGLTEEQITIFLWSRGWAKLK